MDKMPRFRIGAPLRAAALTLLLAGPVLPAAAAGERALPSGLLVQLTPEQHRQMRQEMREHWRQMPPEDRQYMREANRERWQQMPPEDRQRMRDEMRARRGEGGGYGPPGGRRGRP
jgi:Protein of unknown function (DUF3106)